MISQKIDISTDYYKQSVEINKIMEYSKIANKCKYGRIDNKIALAMLDEICNISGKNAKAKHAVKMMFFISTFYIYVLQNKKFARTIIAKLEELERDYILGCVDTKDQMIYNYAKKKIYQACEINLQ